MMKFVEVSDADEVARKDNLAREEELRQQDEKEKNMLPEGRNSFALIF